MASPRSLGWLWIMLVVVWLPGAHEKCIFDEVQQSVTVVPPPTDPERHNRKLRELSPPKSPPQPIRIHTWVPRESPTLSEVERGRLELSVGNAVGIVSSFLSVNRVPGRFLLTRDVRKYCKFIWRNTSAANYNRCGRAHDNYSSETCLGVVIPDDHLSGCAVYPEPNAPTAMVLRPEGAGLPDTDFLLYLHTQSTDKCRAEPSVLAYSVHCQTDSLGRPRAGVVVICRDRLSGDGYSHQGTVQTVVHELFHVLGFSKKLFNTWRDCSYFTQSGVGCSPRGQVTNIDETGQMRIYTQSVIRALQNHLTSTDPELGAPLENLDVGPGGLSSHWESRVLHGSIMAAALGDPALVRVDPVTLAALQDSGWYSVNHSRAQSLVWGEGEGVLFGSMSSCHGNSSFFCSGSGLGCHYLHLHKGECQTDQYLDGCRIYKPLTNRSECWKEENESETDKWTGETYQLDSRCFISNLTRENVSLSVSDSVVGRCYRHRCTGLNRYQIKVFGSEWMACPAGGAIEVTGHRGLVFCPDKRLCYYPDVDLPVIHQTSDSSITEKFVQLSSLSFLDIARYHRFFSFYFLYILSEESVQTSQYLQSSGSVLLCVS
ncbi:hypothetical protein DPEC_G00104900 [Dallia pectoralis]|uniref:Uncharacterized protein n=1 Tax=Dallia pectoralis TaxID=75939 RepID=A0ACC2GY57_DALPE|nr:hypothetical protein DPEC_G00104900 [Dallia pectoralis]